MFTLVQLLILIAAVMGSGSVAAVITWLFFRTRMVQGQEAAALDGRLSDLLREIEAVRGELMHLQEQADFTEKLLSAGSISESAT